ncbi:hypothetical protein [Halosolutus halophilus]|uniref:hypothetical protein n=1 Tax=Halosolutus halophilus TaxID=1552990 RepID=UPI002234FC76|nr:hypothetical protein [Halosolutus halophilus]
MQSMTEILEEMENVKKGSEVIWNGRKHAQTVTNISENSFEVEGTRGGHYRFFLTGTDAPSLTNLNSGRDYDVDEFMIVRRTYPLDLAERF